jgi:hypothetical protein
MTEIILGHPYSGALLGYFSDEIGGPDSHTRAIGHHPYYKTLFGANYHQHVELALNFLLQYDALWITPADTFMPQSKREPDNRNFVPELGLHTEWDDYNSFVRGDNNAEIESFLADPGLQQFLAHDLNLPCDAWSQIVSSAVYEAGLSARRRVPLLCSYGRRSLINKLIEINRPAMHPVFAETGGIRFIDSYINVTGLALKPRNIDDLCIAKEDSDVRRYSAKFVAMVKAQAKNGASADRAAVARLLLDAMNTTSIFSRFSGLLEWGARFIHLFEMTHTGGVLATCGAYITHLVASKAGWYEFAGAINKAIDEKQLIKRLEAESEGKTHD